MDIFIPIFILFTVFVLCSLCGFCCKSRNEGAIFSTPVVITSQTHQPVGSATAYPVHNTSQPATNIHTNYQHIPLSGPTMPMPYSDHSAPYPTGSMPMPYPTATPYPPASYGQPVGAYPPSAPNHSAPYPPPQPALYNQDVQPPPYNEVVYNETRQKQAPYNPNFTG